MRILACALVCALVVGLPATAAAQRASVARQKLALALAKITANERSLNTATPADMALIWQTIRRHGRTARERLSWLRRHSQCVFGDVAPERRRPARRPPRGSNCWWTWHLTDSDEEPTNFTRHQRVEWRRYRRRWARMRWFARRLVAGGVPSSGWPCAHDPDTWGGPMDAPHARRQGMIPLHCVGTANEGYRYARNDPHS